YLKALGIAPGSEVSVPGIIGRTFGSGQVSVTPPAGTAQAAPSISDQFGGGNKPPPAAAAAPPPPPADPAQRKPGVYTTPKAVMTWRGPGWFPPQTATAGAG